MRRNRVVTVITAVVLLTMALTACGSSTKRLAKPDFVTRLDALCKTRDKKTNPLFDKNNPFSAQDASKIWPTAKTVVDDFVNKLEDLNPPKDAKFWDSYLDNAKKAQSGIDKVISASMCISLPLSVSLNAVFPALMPFGIVNWYSFAEISTAVAPAAAFCGVGRAFCWS